MSEIEVEKNTERIEEIDKLYFSPNERTEIIWKLVVPTLAKQVVDEWSMVCFCTGYLTKMAAVYPQLEHYIKNLAQAVYLTHYSVIDMMTEPEKVAPNSSNK